MGNIQYNSLDYNKCILIIMVILDHIIYFGKLYPTLQDAILIIGVPAFIITTGYLVNIKKTWKEFTVYLVRILPPYIIMSLGFGILSLYLPTRYGLSDGSPSTLLRMLLVKPIGPYWYFHTMFICSFLYYISFKSDKPGKFNSYLIFAALLLFCSEYAHLISFRMAFCFFLGAGIRIFCGDFNKFFQPSFLAILPFLLLLSGTPSSWSNLTVTALACCFISFCSYATINRNGKYMNILGYIGRNTFPIYIFHPIFTMISKYTVGFFDYDPTGLIYTFVTVVSCIAGSLCIAYVMDKTHLTWCFGKKSMLR